VEIALRAPPVGAQSLTVAFAPASDRGELRGREVAIDHLARVDRETRRLDARVPETPGIRVDVWGR